jgi:hypothetical protein
MKKALIVIAVLMLGLGGYLSYDWHTKTSKRAAEPSIQKKEKTKKIRGAWDDRA